MKSDNSNPPRKGTAWLSLMEASSVCENPFKALAPRIHRFMRCAYAAILLMYVAFLQHHTHAYVKTIQNIRRLRPYGFWGDRLSGVSAFLSDEKIIGYLTDRSREDVRGERIFAQNQYALAPLILDWNNPDHRYVILDFDDPDRMKQAIETYHLKPFKINNFGIIIAENTDALPRAR